jgi:hypothetical protein
VLCLHTRSDASAPGVQQIVALYGVATPEDCAEVAWEEEGGVWMYRVALMQATDEPSNELPPTEEIAAAWGAGFVLVVGCYAIARVIGAVLSMLK